jgi:outer membrane receptor for ferrienterochelin and colicins
MKIGIRHIAPAAILLSSLFLFPGIPAAQDDRDDVTDAIVRQVPAGEASPQDQTGTHRLDEVVVTATRRAVNRANAPSVVKVITSEEIRRLPWQNFQDIIEFQLGITTFSFQGVGTGFPQDVRIRGTRGTERVLLLVDGQPWNSPFQDYWFFSSVPVEAIERIEIVRGPVSALYGSNAEGGVIHVITRDGWANSPSFGFSGQYKAGDFGKAMNTETVHGTDGKRFSIFASHNHYRTDDYLLNTEFVSPFISGGSTGYTDDRFHVHARAYPVEQLELHLSGGFFDSGTQIGVSLIKELKNRNDVRNEYLNFHGTWIPSGAWEVYFAVDYFSEEIIYFGETAVDFLPLNVAASNNRYGGDRVRGVAGFHWNVFEGNTLTLGGEVYRDRGFRDVTDAGTGALVPQVFYHPGFHLDRKKLNFGVYVQDDWLFFDGRLELVAGVRYDHKQGYASRWSPKGALIWRYLDAGRVRVSAARAFRATNIQEKESPPWSMNVVPLIPNLYLFTTTFIGNEDLGPETVDSFELSLENEFFESRLRTRATPFWVRGDDWIEPTVTAPDPVPPFFAFGLLNRNENIQDVEIKGVEIDVSAKPIDEITIFANYQYQDATDRGSGEQLVNYPNHLARAGATWYSRHVHDFVGLEAGVVVRTTSDYYADELFGSGRAELNGYTLVDTRVGVDFWRQRFRVFGEVFNVTNEQDFVNNEASYLPMRNYFIGGAVQFAF